MAARVATVVVVIALALGCAHRLDRTLVSPRDAKTLDAKAPYLKAHLRSGYVYVLADWHADSGGGVIRGRGRLLDANRAMVDSGEFRFPADSVALFETNVVRPSGANAAISVMAGVTATVAAICALSPKTCFGSCPTFYAPDSGGASLQAEAFSASIAPALEATDLDMLYHARPRSASFELRVTNEALETHVIRFADVIAVPRPPLAGGRVFVTPDGVFRPATGLESPSRCDAAEGDCRAAVQGFDRVERYSAADSVDLAARETVDLEFDQVPEGTLGLVVASRQTLMTTYLIYQTLAYLGTQATTWLARLETGGPMARGVADELGRVLGKIEVLVPDSMGEWRVAGSVGEIGPIAVDTKIVPLPAASGRPLRVRLRLTRGLWRLEYVAIAALGDPVQPVRLRPEAVRHAGRADAAALRALRALRERERPLVTLPGDEYEIGYQLPADYERYELFLEARGYYLEWLRREWLPEENAAAAVQLVLQPRDALRALAPAYKRQEAGMEHSFWNSRYARH